MLIDLVVSNYIRAMHPAKLEMKSLRYAENRMEMFQIMMEAVHPSSTCAKTSLTRIEADALMTPTRLRIYSGPQLHI
jgi:hypothetical protein